MQAGIGQVGDTDDQVEAFAGEVDKGIRQLQIDLDLGIRPHVFRDDRNQEVGAEQNRRTHAQCA
ncbi:hypothetical protein D3C72_2233130 [compost metagenome]